MSVKGPVAVICLAATAGLLFASVSTLDFVAHLDRQVHDLHCSFVPGLAEAAAEGSEGCKVTLMSPYSSVLRRSAWGGVPISLPAMAVFAFILYRAVEFFGRPATQQRAASGVLLGAALIPAAASATMGWIAYSELGAACKLCIGIYVSSAVLLIGALWSWLAARGLVPDGSLEEPTPSSSGRVWGAAALQVPAFVAIPVVTYAAMAPDFGDYIGTCGQFEKVEDPYGVLVPLDDHTGGTPTVEVLDPMCPACKAFEERLGASGLQPRLHRVALLFPLDSSCNWMVSTSLHPGACAVSEAVLCAHRQGLSPTEVLAWAFEHQVELLEAEKKQPGTVAERVGGRFASLRECLGSAEVQSDLNKSLRWAVNHELPVMTPQLFVAGTKLCDEDTDLGMEWALTEILARQMSGALPTVDIVRSELPRPAAAEPDKPASKTRRAARKRPKPIPSEDSGTAAAERAKSPASEPSGQSAEPADAPAEPADAPAEPAEPAEPGKLPSVEDLPDPKKTPEPKSETKADAPTEEEAP